MATKILNLIALTSLAILACNYGPTPANALSVDHQHGVRHLSHGGIVKRKRDQTQRCKQRPSTSSASATPSSTHAATTAQPQATTAKASAAKASSTKASSTSASSAKASAAPAASSTAASSGSSAGQKVCLAWGNGNDPSLANFKTSHVSGLYTWGPDKPTQADSLGYDFWPMLWGGTQDKIDAFQSAVVAGYGSTILGFNEPNESGQSNMSPQSAAALWKQYIQPKKALGYKLLTPAMSSRPNGNQWMTDFIAACDGCTFDGQAVHWYDIGADKLQSYLTTYYNQLHLPIYLTEYADQNFNGGAQATLDEVFTFQEQITKWMDETDWIHAYCPFGAMHDLQGVNTANSLMNSDGSPSDLGYLIINDAE